MGSASSKPVATVSQTDQREKWTTVQRESCQPASPSTSVLRLRAGDTVLRNTTHHASDRLMRIAADAASTTLSTYKTDINDCVSTTALSMPEHNDTHSEITSSALSAWDSVALRDPTTQLAAMTLHNASLKDSVRSRQAEVQDIHVFSHAIPTEGSPRTNQQSSGRCWLFATTNVVRTQVMKQLDLSEFELSQSYLAFWDKLEKSNTFLEHSIDLAERPLDDRVFGFLKTAPTNDGGQWDMVTNLITKYGLVPKSVYPEAYNNTSSSQLNWLITLKLREFALELRELKASTMQALALAGVTDPQIRQQRALMAVRQRKDAQMAQVYRIMVVALGVPPKADEEFTFEVCGAMFVGGFLLNFLFSIMIRMANSTS